MEKNTTIKTDTKALRVINWVFSIGLIFGSFMMIFNATSIGTLYLLFFLVLVIVSYTVPAILLYSGTSKIFGIPIIIDKKNKSMYKISLGVNFLFLLLGVGIILAGVYSGQYIMVVLGFIFTLLSYFNVKTLDSHMKEIG